MRLGPLRPLGASAVDCALGTLRWPWPRLRLQRRDAVTARIKVSTLLPSCLLWPCKVLHIWPSHISTAAAVLRCQPQMTAQATAEMRAWCGAGDSQPQTRHSALSWHASRCAIGCFPGMGHPSTVSYAGTAGPCHVPSSEPAVLVAQAGAAQPGNCERGAPRLVQSVQTGRPMCSGTRLPDVATWAAFLRAELVHSSCWGFLKTL